MKVVVAMSGGVDSSVAAALLKQQGYQVTGVTMKIGNGEAPTREGGRHGCYGAGEAEDIEDASQTAQALGIDFHVLDLSQEYQSEVLDYFCQEYLSGRTPNPCLRCNRQIKFGALLRKTRDSGLEFDYFATGHYARVEYDKSQHRYLLKRAADLNKDQTYFISSLSQEQLSRTLFPLGEYTKAEVRNMASTFDLKIDRKSESQDFIAGGYHSLLAPVAKPGPIMDEAGNIRGEHQGIPFYTIGQRKGLGISAKEPLYVIDINPERNAVIVGSQEALYRDQLIAFELNWIAIASLTQPTEVIAKIRYLHPGSEAVVTPLGEDSVHVKFKEPQMAITPGQAVVFYQRDVVIGSGLIERTGDE